MGIKQSVIKQLWGAANNQCAHPDCDEPISDPDQEMVIGEICHIHARNENGPRYDPSLDETEVNSMSNLVLLCPTHHTRIDKDPDSYPAEILQEWRKEQISDEDTEDDVSDSILEGLIDNSGDISIESDRLSTPKIRWADKPLTKSRTLESSLGRSLSQFGKHWFVN